MVKIEWMGFELEGPAHVMYPAFVAGVGFPVVLVAAFVWLSAGPAAGVGAGLAVAVALVAFDRFVVP